MTTNTTDISKIRATIDDFQTILEACKGSVYLEYNGHKNDYESLTDYIYKLRSLANSEDEIDKELEARILAADKIYELQFYPNTPVSFYKVYGTSLEEVISQAKGNIKYMSSPKKQNQQSDILEDQAISKDTRHYTDKELQEKLSQMNKLLNSFYWQCFNINCHGFIEFNGLMGEYLKICQNTLDSGQDFTTCNIHTGVGLNIQDHNINYIAEKFTCIFGASLDEKRLDKLFNAIKLRIKAEYHD